VKELQVNANATANTKEEPERLGLQNAGEYDLFTILRAHAKSEDEAYLADCSRKMLAHIRSRNLLTPGWSNSKGGRMRVEQSLLAESWNPQYASLGFDADDAEPAFLKPAVEELAKSDA
jgi:type I restriction enzyme R subunit